LAADVNPLIQNDLPPPIRWWSIVIFLAVLPLVLLPAVWLIGSREMLAMLYPETIPSDPNGRQQPCGDPKCHICSNGLARTMWNHK